MFFFLQFISCMVDTTLILFLLKFIIDAPVSLTPKTGFYIAAFSAAGAAVDFFTGGTPGTAAVIFLFPLVLYLRLPVRRALLHAGRYLLAFLLYVSFSIISIFIEMLIFEAAFGITDTNTRYTLITICLNALIIWGMWKHFGKPGFRIQFTIIEWLMLLAVNIITFIILTAVLFLNDQILIRNTGEQILILVLNYSVLFFYAFFVLFLAGGKAAAHYRNLNQLNQKHMAEQLKYFTAYKAMQAETRSFQHDIKNHLLYLETLSSENKLPEIQAYLQSLTCKWKELPRLFITGNDVLDSILNAKQFLLDEHKIILTLSGDFTGALNILPIDLCTIFSNAVDNAVEAVSQLPPLIERQIKLEIKNNHNFNLITLQNPVAAPVLIKNNHVVSDKKSNVNEHGYGLKNISRALQPYDGYMRLTSTDTNFCVDIVIPNRPVK